MKTANRNFVRLSHLRKLRECEQVAAVCYRIRREEIEFLLVQTGGGRWIFPKGSAEPGLTHAQAAALEAYEEAGVHGRIQEVPFARFARSLPKAGPRKSTASSAKELSITVHLCEVSCLTSPQESNRNRTWFSPKDAKLRLREGRDPADGSAFARVLDKAVARIQTSRQEPKSAHDSTNTDDWNRHPQLATKNDALQSVSLEAFQFPYARSQNSALMPYVSNQLRAIGAPPREILQAEILEFTPTRGKRPKALGTGTRNR